MLYHPQVNRGMTTFLVSQAFMESTLLNISTAMASSFASPDLVRLTLRSSLIDIVSQAPVLWDLSNFTSPQLSATNWTLASVHVAAKLDNTPLDFVDSLSALVSMVTDSIREAATEAASITNVRVMLALVEACQYS